MKQIKNVSKLFILLVVIIVTLPFLYDIFDQQEDIDDTKKVQIINSKLMGYDQGKLSWKIQANNVWSKKKRYYYYADHIFSGVVYDDSGDVSIDSIHAKELTINTKSNSFSIYGGVTARLNLSEEIQQKGLVAKKNNKEQIKIKSKEMRYFSENKRTYLNQDVELMKDDTIISPFKEVEIDNEDNIAYIYHGFNLRNSDVVVTGNQMIMFIDDYYSTFKGDLVFEQLPSKNMDNSIDEKEQELRKVSTFLYAQYASFEESSTNNILVVSENVKLVQPGKVVVAQQAKYIQDKELFSMRKDVVLELENLKWLLDESTKETLENEDIKSSLHDKTTIYCDNLIFNGKARETKLFGNIKIIQSDKVISCKRLILFDDTAIVECSGDVEIIKDNENTMSTQFLTIDLKNEIFTAKKGVYSEYHLEN